MADFQEEVVADCLRAWELVDAQQQVQQQQRAGAQAEELARAMAARAAELGLAQELAEPRGLHRYRGTHLTFFYEWTPSSMYSLVEAVWMPEGESAYATWQRGRATILLSLHDDGDEVLEEEEVLDTRTRGRLGESMQEARLRPVFDRAAAAGIALSCGFPRLHVMHRFVCTVLSRSSVDRSFD